MQVTSPSQVLTWVASLLLGNGPQAADDFSVEMTASAPPGRQITRTETSGLSSRSKSRPVLHLKRKQALTVKWTVTCTAPQANYKDLLIHFFVVKEPVAGQRAVPKLDKDVFAESALTMDFKPRDKATGELTHELESAGAYLLRLETIGAIGTAGHEFFAAMDLVVE